MKDYRPYGGYVKKTRFLLKLYASGLPTILQPNPTPNLLYEIPCDQNYITVQYYVFSLLPGWLNQIRFIKKVKL